MRKASGTDIVRRAAERYGGEFRVAILASLDELQAALPVETIVRALEEGNAGDLIRLLAIPVLVVPAAAVLEQMMQSATHAGVNWVLNETGQGTAGPFVIDFAAIDQRASDWAATQWRDLWFGITDEAQQVIRDVVSRAPIEGITYDQQARLIRSSLGLTRRQAAGYANRLAALLGRAGVLTGAQMRVQIARLDRWRARQIAHRARMIAVNETRLAALESQRQAWQAAASHGLLDRATDRVVWVVAEGACDLCLSLEGTLYGIDDALPKTHPWCHCRTELVFNREKTLVSKPLGRFPDFDACVTAMTVKLGSRPAAERYCGALEQRING